MTFSNITWMHLPASFFTFPRSGNFFSPSLWANSQECSIFSVLQQNIRNKQQECPKCLSTTKSEILKQFITICLQPRTFDPSPRETAVNNPDTATAQPGTAFPTALHPRMHQVLPLHSPALTLGPGGNLRFISWTQMQQESLKLCRVTGPAVMASLVPCIRTLEINWLLPQKQ